MFVNDFSSTIFWKFLYRLEYRWCISTSFNRNFQGCISIELSRNFAVFKATALLRYHRAFSKSTKNLKIFFELFYLQNLDFKALADHYILALILMPFRYTLFDRKKNPLNIREFFSVWYIWKERRRRDLNPRAGFPTYTLSRGASSASWVLLLRPECLYQYLNTGISIYVHH